MLDTAIQAWGSLAMETIIAFGVLFNVRQVVVAGHAAVTAAHRAEKAALEAAAHVVVVATNVARIEEHTNSMQEKLIDIARAEGHAEGVVAAADRK